MAKHDRVASKLALRRETVRNLQSLDAAALAHVAGGLLAQVAPKIEQMDTRKTTNRP